MRKVIISALMLGSMTLAAQTTEAGRVPMYSSGFLTLPYGAAPGLTDGVSMLGFGVNSHVFSMSSVEEKSRVALSTMPNLGGDSGPQSLVTRLGFEHPVNDNTTVLGDFTYFQSGEVELRDAQGNELGLFTPSETAVRLGVVQRFNEDLRAGVRLGYLSTNLGSSTQNTQITEGALTADFSVDYAKELDQGELSLYWALNNVGRKNSFSESNLNYLPTHMQLGAGMKMEMNDGLTWAPGLSFHKFLVPTPPTRDASGTIISGQAQSTSFFGSMFGSFADAPGGFSEELSEWRVNLASEFLIKESIYIGTGLSWEAKDKGNRQLLNLGVGYMSDAFNVGLGYYIPLTMQSAYYEGVVGLNVSFSF